MKHEYLPPPTEPYEDLPGFDIPTPAEIEEVNSLYPAYIFFEQRKGGRFLQTSCCHREEFFADLRRTMSWTEWQVASGKHNEMANCPFCGREAQLKNIARLGKRRKLQHYEPVIFLKERAGDLYALAYWTGKDYEAELTEPARFMFIAAYHFSPGRARALWDAIGSGELYEEVLEGNYDPNHRKITEPFVVGGYMFRHYTPYNVIGIEAISRSSFRYCQYNLYHQAPALHTDLMKYLAACCIYPRNIEMLMKAGPKALVIDLVEGRCKNADIIKWGVNDPYAAFGLDKQEFKEFMKKQDLDVLRVYKYMKRRKAKPTFSDAENIEACLRYEAMPFLKLCAKYKLKPMQTLRYLDKFCGPRCYGGYFTVHNAFILWRDYLQAAAAIGYDMQNEVVLRPKNLDAAHNTATAEHNRRLQLEREEQRRREEAERAARNAEYRRQNAERLEKERLEREAEEKRRAEEVARRRSRYTFEADGYFIRPAENADEIIAEGKILQHCVAGYAGRHMDGVLTICFLRSAAEPDKPLVTIEMNNKGQLVQAHGFKNEREGSHITGKVIAPDPREAYKFILDPWLKWVAAGSKRDADGKPIMPGEKKKRKVKEVTAA